MVGTRNTTLTPVEDDHVQNWVNEQLEAKLERLKDELTIAIQSALSDLVQGVQTLEGKMFFEIDHVLDPHKVQLASIRLYDTASLWHRQFVKLIRHVGTIEEYHNAFDKLVSRVDLPEDQQISFYIAGLQSEVELAVRMFRPKSLTEVYNLSKIQKAAIKLNKQSTHNFLDIDKAKKLGCHLSSACPSQVDIAGKAHVTSKYMCKKFAWKIHGEEFVVDVMLFPLGGCDMVLGV
ncbi:hypothetical protein Tco_0915530 [Tanacetum coccineum]